MGFGSVQINTSTKMKSVNTSTNSVENNFKGISAIDTTNREVSVKDQNINSKSVGDNSNVEEMDLSADTKKGSNGNDVSQKADITPNTGTANNGNNSNNGNTNMNFGPMKFSPELQDVMTNSKGVQGTGNGITNKNTFNVENSDLNTITSSDIQKIVGTLSYEEYKDFVDGVEKYYENQEEYLNNVLNGTDGKSGYKGLLEDVNYKLDMTETLYKQEKANFDNSIHSEWELTEDLKNSGVDFDKFMEMSYDKQIEFVGDKNSTIINLLAEKKAFEDDYNKGVEENYASYGITTMDGLFKFRDELQTYVNNIEAAIDTTKNNKESAKYDYLYFTEDYQNYNFNTEFSSEDLDTLACSKNGAGEYRYSLYHEKYPDVSLTEYYMMVNEIEPNALVYDIDGKNITYTGSDFRTIAKIGTIAPMMAKTYQYYLDKDPEIAKQFMKDCEYEINQYKGQLEAQEFLDSLYTIETEDGITIDVCKGIANELGVSWEGIKDGVSSFGEGLYYVLEAFFTGFTGEENRTLSVEEYKRMYIAQTLLSEKDKINLGLITRDEDGNLINTNPNCPIDYTKDYNGALLNENYQFNQGIGDMVPSIAISLANPTAGSVVFGASIGGNAYHSSMVEGNSYLSSLGYGIFTGSSEAITQRFIGGIPGLSDAEVTSFKGYLNTIKSEAFQESFQATMDYIYKASFMGYELPTTVEGWKAIAEDILEQGAYGAVTAGYLNCSPNVQVTFKNDVNTNSNSNVDTDVKVPSDKNTTFGDIKNKAKDAINNNDGSTVLIPKILNKIFGDNGTDNNTTAVKPTTDVSIDAKPTTDVSTEGSTSTAIPKADMSKTYTTSEIIEMYDTDAASIVDMFTVRGIPEETAIEVLNTYDKNTIGSALGDVNLEVMDRNINILANSTGDPVKVANLISASNNFDLKKIIGVPNGINTDGIGVIGKNVSVYGNIDKNQSYEGVYDYIREATYGKSEAVEEIESFHLKAFSDGNIGIRFSQGAMLAKIYVPTVINDYQINQLKALNYKIQEMCIKSPDYYKNNPMEFRVYQQDIKGGFHQIIVDGKPKTLYNGIFSLIKIYDPDYKVMLKKPLVAGNVNYTEEQLSIVNSYKGVNKDLTLSDATMNSVLRNGISFFTIPDDPNYSVYDNISKKEVTGDMFRYYTYNGRTVISSMDNYDTFITKNVDAINKLDSTIRQTRLTSDTTLYRYVEFNSLESFGITDVMSEADVISKIMGADTYCDYAFSSTSSQADTSPIFQARPIVFEMDCKAGTPALDFTDINKNNVDIEYEVLLTPCQKFKIIGAEYKDSFWGRKLHIYMKSVD